MRVRLKGSIGAIIFLSFIAMGAITGALGGYGLFVLSQADQFVVDTYDRSLMSISYARSAGLSFARLDKEMLRRSVVAPAEREPIDRQLDQLLDDFFGDLSVARDRAASAEERAGIAEISDLANQWRRRHLSLSSADTTPDLDELGERIIERLDRLIEMTADASFVARRKAVDAMRGFNYTSILAIILALLMSWVITFLLARRIVRPLAAAAVIADRIAKGKFETVIPRGGNDETGALLRSMHVMQDSIRTLVAREQAQRRSAQNRLIAAMESSNEAMALVDPDGQLVVANQQLSRFVPSLARRLEGGALFSLAFADVAKLTDELGRTTALGDAMPANVLATGYEFRIGDGRWLRVSRSQTQDGGFFLVLSDLSDIKERETRLDEARQEAEAANAAKTTFLANMSHELRTPLNAIIGFSEIMAGEFFGSLGSAKYVEYAGNIKESGDHLLGIINSVLDFTKSQAGKLQLNLEVFDLCDIVESCVTIIGEQCKRAGLQFDLALPDESITMNADAAKIRQILLNLLSNAIKFTEPGGRVTVNLDKVEGRVRLLVTDTGIGMSPEDIPIAFAAFGQIDSRLARRYEGTGLGLPLTKALVELHQGSITVDSTLGRGTSISVLLPEARPYDGSSAEGQIHRAA